MNIKSLLFLLISITLTFSCYNSSVQEDKNTKIINHKYASLEKITDGSINHAKAVLHVAYGHTSHGSQLITGMAGLVTFKGDLYKYSNGGGVDSLDLRDTPFSGASDLGNPNRTTWAASTRNYLDSHPEINVVIWSWCGQVSTASESDILTYLTLMNQLESEYAEVVFVYMTGHLDGSGENGNLNLRNQQIRQFCIDNDKYLYDFADIESYDPDGNTNYMKLRANDVCYYDSSGNGTTVSYETNPPDPCEDLNWAEEWQNSHLLNVDWYNCSSVHSRPLNSNLKAYAAWNLFCIIAENL